MNVNKGILKGFSGSWMSGLGTIHIFNIDTGIVENIPCENAPTVRALEACFGNVIGSAHNVKDDPGFMDQEVYYSLDDMGLIFESFTPIHDASVELIDAYQKELKENSL